MFCSWVFCFCCSLGKRCCDSRILKSRVKVGLLQSCNCCIGESQTDSDQQLLVLELIGNPCEYNVCLLRYEFRLKPLLPLLTFVRRNVGIVAVKKANGSQWRWSSCFWRSRPSLYFLSTTKHCSLSPRNFLPPLVS